MRRSCRVALLLCCGLVAATARAQSPGREPHVGYVFPAGGQRGSTFEVTVGGQYLQAVSEAYVSGTGVRARVVRTVEPIHNLDGEQVREVFRRLAEAARGKLEALTPEQRAALPDLEGLAARGAGKAGEGKAVEVPDLPLLRDLESRTLEEIAEIARRLLNPRLRLQQVQRAIAEQVVVAITIDPAAPAGDREIRLRGAGGLSNPLCFEVGTLPERTEREPNDPRAAPIAAAAPPFVLNGQIGPGDVDQYRFTAREGQHLVLRVRARALMPYLADAVPGWFQATLALRDAHGVELAYADDCGPDPDPVLVFDVPADGEYEAVVTDALYRGRDDFVYRLAVGELPFVTSLFPLGGPVGGEVSARATGHNLGDDQVNLDLRPDPARIRETRLVGPGGVSNAMLYAVDALPECVEAEPNDLAGNAQTIELPRIVNGRIDRPGDADTFAFEGRAGDEVVLEVTARRLGAPTDSIVELRDGAGAVIAWNDDTPDKRAGLVTHQSDSYVRASLPGDGRYTVRVADAQGQGGDACGYRLRVSAPVPDFALRVTPASLSLTPGRAVVVRVFALRGDGFAGDVQVVLRDAPPGFLLTGGLIPAGQESARMTITAPRQPLADPVALELQGQGEIGGRLVARPAIPAEDMMQAFAYQHLVPAHELLAVVAAPRRSLPAPAFTVQAAPVRIPSGGGVRVATGIPNIPLTAGLRLELSDPPVGITLAELAREPGGLVLALACDGDPARVGLRGNLIVEMSAEIEPGGKEGTGRKQRVALGPLPAIPFEVVAP